MHTDGGHILQDRKGLLKGRERKDKQALIEPIISFLGFPNKPFRRSKLNGARLVARHPDLS
jgi:hypothetical protein